MTPATSINEDLQGQLTYVSLIWKGIVSVGTLLVTSTRDVMKLRQTSDAEEHYTRPQRRYDLPNINDSVRGPQRREKYLRPTHLCDSRAPLVVALAQELGAGKVSDREFAEAAFDFAKNRMTLEIAPIDGVVETLERGTGTCFGLITVFIALCRAAGIKARYKIFSTTMIDAWRGATIDADPLLQKWHDSMGYFLMEGEGEAFIDGEWLVAHVGPTDERQAAAGIPISRLGEDAIGSWFQARPGTIMRLESLPRGLASGSRLLHKISPGSMERVNASVIREIAKGHAVIEAAGGLTSYDRMIRDTKQQDAKAHQTYTPETQSTQPTLR